MLGEKVKDALKNAGITHTKAAAEMGISEGSLYNIFKKDSFEIAYLLKISELVGLPASYFLGKTARNVVPPKPAISSKPVTVVPKK